MILALESSCDETAVALFDPEKGTIEDLVHSQIALHGRHGGVVPDLATREHLRTFGPLLAQVAALQGWKLIDKIAVTNGPGLAACLAIGLSAAKAVAVALGKPLIGVNHLRGHVWSPFIALQSESPETFSERLQALLPHIGLVVSGGNTILFEIDENRRVKVRATTRDDAAGEALDKGAKLLGLGYPGGPQIEMRAKGGSTDAFDFPRGIGPRSDLDFSFSGLKTSLRYQIEKMSVEAVQSRMSDLCASYQQAVIDALARKLRLAAGQMSAAPRSLGLSGGVANNRALRAEVGALAAKLGVPLLAAQPKHTGDNAAMIAFAAWLDQEACDNRGLSLTIAPNLEL